MITIVGLGLERGQITLDGAQALKSGAPVVLRTEQCEAAAWLTEQGVQFETLDTLYEAADDFDRLNDALAQNILARSGDVVYGVLDLRDESVLRIAREGGLSVRLIAGVPVDGVLTALQNGPVTVLAAADADGFQPESDAGTLVRELNDRTLASEVKLRLLERYPADHAVYVARAGEQPTSIALEDLDRLNKYDHTLCAYVPPVGDIMRLERYGFNQLNAIMRVLRGPNGCPWDKAQTHESIRTNVVEEAWEVADAIARDDPDALYDELGDLLLQITLHAEIARQHGEFDIDDVTTAICRKMISRHSHVFGRDTATSPDQVLDLWDENKRRERGITGPAAEMRAVAKGLPALMRAEKLLKKAGSLDRPCDETGDAREQIGEMLMDAVRAARAARVHPELALQDAADRLIERVAQATDEK